MRPPGRVCNSASETGREGTLAGSLTVASQASRKPSKSVEGRAQSRTVRKAELPKGSRHGSSVTGSVANADRKKAATFSSDPRAGVVEREAMRNSARITKRFRICPPRQKTTVHHVPPPRGLSTGGLSRQPAARAEATLSAVENSGLPAAKRGRRRENAPEGLLGTRIVRRVEGRHGRRLAPQPGEEEGAGGGPSRGSVGERRGAPVHSRP